MSSNVAITAGTGTTMKTTDNSGVHTPHHNIELNSVAVSVSSGNKDTGTQRVAIATDDISMVALLARAMGSAPAASTHQLLTSAATTNGTSVKASAGTLHRVLAFSKRASDCWLKIYNKASAPTVGTDTPILTLNIPAGGYLDLALPVTFATGLAYAITGAAAIADTTAVAAGDVVGLNILYS